MQDFATNWGPLIALICGLATIARIFIIAGEFKSLTVTNADRLDRHSKSIETNLVLMRRVEVLPKRIENLDKKIDERYNSTRQDLLNLRGRVDEIFTLVAKK